MHGVCATLFRAVQAKALQQAKGRDRVPSATKGTYMSGLLALLDDVSAIAKVAAASVDDISAAAAKAGSKAAGVVIDDAEQNITHVTRGRDLMAATHIHRVLQLLLGLPEPQYFHHELVRDISGRRLSKQAGDPGFRGLRQDGYSRDDVIAALPAPIGSGAPL